MRYFDITARHFQLTFSSISEIFQMKFRQIPRGWLVDFTCFTFFSSNDEIEEADPGSDSDFEIDTKKEVSCVISHDITSCITHNSLNSFLRL